MSGCQVVAMLLLVLGCPGGCQVVAMLLLGCYGFLLGGHVSFLEHFIQLLGCFEWFPGGYGRLLLRCCYRLIFLNARLHLHVHFHYVMLHKRLHF